MSRVRQYEKDALAEYQEEQMQDWIEEHCRDKELEKELRDEDQTYCV